MCVLMCATLFSTASAFSTKANGVQASGTWVQSERSDMTASRDAWLRYDDGTAENSLGLTAGGTLYEFIKLTPTELAGYNGNVNGIMVMHGCPDYPGADGGDFTVICYTGTSQPANPETDGTIVATGTVPAIDDYVYVWFNDTQYAFTETDTVWVGIGWVHNAGTYPCGFDTSACTPGKGDYLWFPGGQWYELGAIGYPGNWNLAVHLSTGDTQAPVTTCTITGTNPVTITLTATDATGVAYTMYKIDSGTFANYTGPITYSTAGDHVITYYSVDVLGNVEDQKTTPFTVEATVTIAIKGGFGITATVTNTGADPIDVTGNIAVTGLVFPKA